MNNKIFIVKNGKFLYNYKVRYKNKEILIIVAILGSRNYGYKVEKAFELCKEV